VSIFKRKRGVFRVFTLFGKAVKNRVSPGVFAEFKPKIAPVAPGCLKRRFRDRRRVANGRTETDFNDAALF
jgi:hypothetical protein